MSPAARRPRSRLTAASGHGYTIVELIVYIGLLTVFMSSLFLLFRRSRQITSATCSHARQTQRALCVKGVFEKDVRLSDGTLDRFVKYCADDRTLVLHVPSFVSGGERVIVYCWDGGVLERAVLDHRGAALSRRSLMRPAGASFRREGGHVALDLLLTRAGQKRRLELTFCASSYNGAAPRREP